MRHLPRCGPGERQSRKVDYYQEDDGTWIIRARLPAEAGALVIKALEAVAKPIQQEKQEEVQKSISAEIFSETTEPQEQTLDVESRLDQLDTHPQTQADSLVIVAEHFLATCDQYRTYKGLKGSERCQIMLHVDINTLHEHSCEGQSQCNLEGKHWISPKTAKRLSCDATLVTVLENEQGKVLNIGRRSRTVPANIKRALDLRDTTCRVPGCCQTSDLDAHHIQHWVDGGETSMDNLVHLCRFHHMQLHLGIFNIQVQKPCEQQSEAHMLFSTPGGQEIPASFSPQFPNQSLSQAEEALTLAAPEVNSKTCVTRWRGESCDYNTAVGALLDRDDKLVALDVQGCAQSTILSEYISV